MDFADFLLTLHADDNTRGDAIRDARDLARVRGFRTLVQFKDHLAGGDACPEARTEMARLFRAYEREPVA